MTIQDSVDVEAKRQPDDMEVWSKEEFPERAAQDGEAPDVNCQHFREFCYQEDGGPRALCSQLHRLCHQWLKPEKCSKTEMLDLIILEQFLAVLPTEMMNWVRACRPESTSQAVSLAEGFLLSQTADKKQEEQEDISEFFSQALTTPPDPKQKPFHLENTKEKGGGTDMPDPDDVLGTNPCLSILCREVEIDPLQPEQGSVTFEDITVSFTEEEWALLGSDQRTLHQEVMEENYANVLCLAPSIQERRLGEERLKGHLGKVREEGKPWGIKTEMEEKRNESFPFPHGHFCESLFQRELDQNIESSMCSQSPNCETSLNVHWQVLQGRKMKEGSECSEEFCATSSTERDLTTQRKEESFRYLSCENSTGQSVDFALDTSPKTGGKPFECPDCGKKFGHNSPFAHYMGSHPGMKPFPCSKCGKCFSQRTHLVDHMRIHTGEKPFECPECGNRFGHKRSLESHMRIHAGTKPFTCLECGKSFRARSTLSSHQKIHTGEKSFKCSECGKSFRHKSTLRSHMRIHTGEKPFPCLECGRSFACRNTLSFHRRIHTGEKPYECVECGKRYSVKRSLAFHVRIHTGEKPFECSVCGKRLSYKQSLASHMRIHTREKSFKCSECGTSFRDKSTLHSHVRTHTGEIV